jgi:hypothetical protein
MTTAAVYSFGRSVGVFQYKAIAFLNLTELQYILLSVFYVSLKKTLRPFYVRSHIAVLF